MPAVSASYWLRREGSGVAVDRVLLRLPYFGGLMRMYATSQLARTLSTLLAGGLPLVNALEVAAASIGNRAMARRWRGAARRIREGKSLTTALESTGMLESLALEMVKVGEQTGALGDMLSAIAEFYDEELDTRMADRAGAGRARDAGGDGGDRGGDAAGLLPADVPGDLGRPADGAGREHGDARSRSAAELGARRHGGGAGAGARRALPASSTWTWPPSRPTRRSCSRCRWT